ncbi:translation initiation factor IF-2 [Streptomyces sp. NRRL F-5755]|uniref:restriction endonuclease n=1 Tax=Streptomyces sp. NRRL F-5755 TaxID=1519475 RepID=UPI0006AEB391|nr:restriction endonuclease [Streptomyces sp. NRRL F-5755]KOT86747.1 translation initiation factor IF-2 [Streptomyces sp. NRRL F-5755]
MRRTVFVLAVIGALLCGGFLAVREAARWAVAHPGPALGVGAVVLPLLVALAVVAVRGMPRLRELRRAARAGKAEAEAEVAAMAEAAPVAEAGPVVEAEAADVAPWRVEDFLALDADGFEQAIARLCERDGCRDVQVVGGAGDLGADVLATAADGRRLIIQCKRYGETNKVGSQDVQRFGGTCFTVHEAEVAAVVTTSIFTEPAADYAATCGIRCYDGERLVAWANGDGAAPWA